MITLEVALESAKRFIAKMKGLDMKFSGRPLIDYLDFYIVRKEETPDHYTLFINLNDNLYSSNSTSFRVGVNKETGNVEDIERIFEE